MSTTSEKIAVMQAYDDGKEIQRMERVCGSSCVQWYDDPHPSWDWGHYIWRVKPEPCNPREWLVLLYKCPGDDPAAKLGILYGLEARHFFTEREASALVRVIEVLP